MCVCVCVCKHESGEVSVTSLHHYSVCVCACEHMYVCSMCMTFTYFASFRWNYQLAGGLSPVGFHVVNITLHGVVSVLFLSVFTFLLGQRSSLQAAFTTSGGARGGPASVSKAAFLCSLLFAVHPVHTESVGGGFV